MKKEKGFTLAEVLITLGIIGVVAAMTMPTLVNNSRNQECRAGLKTGYSLISNALTAMRADELSTRSGDYASREFTSVFRDYFKLGSNKIGALLLFLFLDIITVRQLYTSQDLNNNFL